MAYLKELKALSKNVSILYVEDDKAMRESVANYLKLIFDDLDYAEDGVIGLERYTNKHYDIVITDIQMPRKNGLEMISEIKKHSPEQEIVITTAFSETPYMMEAISYNVSAYVIKPIDFDLLNYTLYKIVKKINVFRENEQYKTSLEKMVKERTAANLELEEEKIDNYEKTLLSLVGLVEKRDTYTGGHSLRVAQYSKLIAQKMGYDEETCEMLYRAGILHDIGKVETPDAVLLKPGSLDELEYKLIKEHVTTGSNMLSKIPMYQKLSEVIASHHERYDGKGYPNGLKGDEISNLSRIMIVADSFDAMTTNRIYKPRKSLQDALLELKQFSGTQFHPEIVDTALEVFSTLELNANIFQLPSTEMESKRFAFFFEDQLTKAYNKAYLELLLVHNKNDIKGKRLDIILIQNFSRYNFEYGWDKGDLFLQELVKTMRNAYPDTLIFRLHGDDFVLCSKEEIDFDLNLLDPLLKDAKEILHVRHKKLNTKEDSLNSLVELDRILKA